MLCCPRLDSRGFEERQRKSSFTSIICVNFISKLAMVSWQRNNHRQAAWIETLTNHTKRNPLIFIFCLLLTSRLGCINEVGITTDYVTHLSSNLLQTILSKTVVGILLNCIVPIAHAHWEDVCFNISHRGCIIEPCRTGSMINVLFLHLGLRLRKRSSGSKTHTEYTF